MQDARIDDALDRLTHGTETTAIEALEDLASLSVDAPPWQTVVEALVIGETSFFRQATWFSQLEQHVLKPLIERRLLTGPKRLRLWSAACATGEEPYTLAIIIEGLLRSHGDWEISIVGTDINAGFLAQARRGVYREWSLREVGHTMRAHHFQQLDSGRLELKASTRAMVSFRTLNLVDEALPHDDPRLSDLDLIVCRNALMYLTPAHQRALALRLAGRLGLDGWLAVAPAEATADWYRPLMPVNVPSAIFFRRAPPVPQAQPRSGTHHHNISDAVGPARSRTRPRRDVSISITDVGIDRIRVLADRGDLAEARGHCEALLSNDALNYDASLLLALICEEMNDPLSSLEAARRATYIKPDSAPAHFLCGTTLSRLGHTRQARRTMRTVLRLLDADAVVTSDSWDVSEERLRTAAGDYLAGMQPESARPTVGTAE